MAMDSFLDTQPWYHGKITRTEAENLLHNKEDGTFLLRDSTTSEYAISVAYQGNAVHYLVERHPDGKYGIETGPRFSSPIHLVAHHQYTLDGLLTKLSKPCHRLAPRPQSAYGLDSETEKMIKDIVDKIGPNNPILEDDLRGTISKNLHTNKPWYHGPISRVEAERRLREGGSEDGMFLVRDSHDPPGSFAIGLSFARTIYHYHLRLDPRKRLCIEGGPKFSSLFEAVLHYSKQADGLLYPLLKPCPQRSQTLPRPPSLDQRGRTHSETETRERTQTGPFAALNQGPHSQSFDNSFNAPPSPVKRLPPTPPAMMHPPPPSANTVMHPPSVSPTLPGQRPPPPPLPGQRPAANRFSVPQPMSMHPPSLQLPGPSPLGASAPPPIIAKQKSAAPPPSALMNRPPPPPRLDAQARELPAPPVSPGAAQFDDSQDRAAFEKIYDTVSMKKCLGYTNCFKGIKEVKFSSLTLDEKVIGTGCFGSVLKGIYTMPRGEQIPVAVKSLKTSDISEHQRAEIITEARIMTALDHSNIVRMVGLCQSSTGAILLVMELAEEGPLHKYLKVHNTFPLVNILIMMLQVTEGMAYLAEKKLIHRDLAARNVLVVSKDFVKISDFGLSKAMGVGEEYYKAANYGKWPLKWYAPECILFRKFSPESDVWSYGVTVYEAVTYGGKPYKGMDGRTIISKLEEGYRLECPINCPKAVYELMYSCWEWKPENRPTFIQLGNKLAKYITLSKR